MPPREKRPKVSVCIPTYGRAGVLPMVIRSVLSQTYPDFELFISDDASPDNTEDVVRSYKDARVRYHKNRVNLGVKENWDFIIRNARGDLVFKLDDDDYIAPQFLEKIVPVFAKYPDVGSVYTGFFYAGGYEGEFKQKVVDNVFFKSDRAKGIDYVRSYLLRTCIPGLHPSATVFRYSLAEEICFYEKAKNDLMFSLALASKADIGYIPEPLFYYVQHSDSRASYDKGKDPELLNFNPTRFIEDFFAIDFIRDNPALMAIKDTAMKRERIARSVAHLVMCRRNFSLADFIDIAGNLVKRDKKLLLSPLFVLSLLGSMLVPGKLMENLSYMYKGRRFFSKAIGKIFRREKL